MKYILGILIILFATYADIFLHRIHIIPVTPSQFLLPLFMVVFLLKYPIRDVFARFNSHSFKFFFGMLMLSIVFSGITKASMEVIITNISLDIITLILYLFMFHYFCTEDKKTVFLVVFLSFIVLAGSVWYDFFIGLPEYSKKLAESTRKGGFGENPNKAASGIKFLALGVLFFLDKVKTKKYLFIAVMFFSVFITFSRSGTISAILIIIFGTMNNWSTGFRMDLLKLIKSSFKVVIIFSFLYVLLLAFADVIRDNFPAFTRGEAGERLDLLTGKSKKSVIAEDVNKGGGGGRGDLLFKYMDAFMEFPIGYGTGYTDDKKYNGLNTHNHYLYMAVNFGIIGLLMYLVFLGYGLNLSYKSDQFFPFVFIALFLFEGLIAHNVFYERSVLVSLAFFDSIIYRKSYA